MAGVAAQAVLDMQAGAVPGALGTELEIGTNFQFVVHQASGMVAVQLGVSVAEALIRLRAHAFQHDRIVADVARDVVDRRLRFDGRHGPVRVRRLPGDPTPRCRSRDLRRRCELPTARRGWPARWSTWPTRSSTTSTSSTC